MLSFSGLVGGNISRQSEIMRVAVFTGRPLVAAEDSTAAPVMILVRQRPAGPPGKPPPWLGYFLNKTTSPKLRATSFIVVDPTNSTLSPRSYLYLLLHISGSTSVRCASMKSARSMKDMVDPSHGFVPG